MGEMREKTMRDSRLVEGRCRDNNEREMGDGEREVEGGGVLC